MTDVFLIQGAKMQKRIKDLEHSDKIKTNMLRERDEQITKLRGEYEKEIQKLKDEIEFKNRIIKTMKPKPRMRKVKNEK